MSWDGNPSQGGQYGTGPAAGGGWQQPAPPWTGAQEPVPPQNPYGPPDAYGAPHQNTPHQNPYGQPQAPYGQQASNPCEQVPNAYGTPPPYGQPSADQGQYQEWQQYQNPAPKPKRTGLIVGVVVVGVVAAGGIAAAVALNHKTSATPSAHTVVDLPTSAGPLTQLVSADTTQRSNSLLDSLKGNQSYPSPKVAFYRIGSDQSFSAWILLQPTTNSTYLSSAVSSTGASAMLGQFMTGAAITDAQPIPQISGAAAAASCGHKAEGAVHLTMCAWVDGSSFAWTYFEPSVAFADAVTDTVALRQAAEH